MAITTFVTGNQSKHEEISRLLAGVEIRWQKLSLSSHDAADLAELARLRALEAFDKLRAPCFLEATELDLDGGPRLSGAEFKKRLLSLGEAAFCQRYGGRRGRAKVAVAFAASGAPEGVTVFEGEIEGDLLSAPRGDGGYGWDRCFLPEGYQRTLGEMAENKCFLNMRHRPYLLLADLLRGRSFGGTFESHVTVTAEGPEARARFEAACARLSVKCVWIELPRGESRSQPMTACYHRGALREVQEEVYATARALALEGFDVTRIKIEAMGTNRDIPQSDEEAMSLPQNYFEYHAKVTLPRGADLDPIRVRCEAHGAHLSRNARKVRADGSAERFVTLRVPGHGRPRADERFQALLASLAETGLPLSHRVREYTVYDSNAALDRGWLRAL